MEKPPLNSPLSPHLPRSMSRRLISVSRHYIIVPVCFVFVFWICAGNDTRTFTHSVGAHNILNPVLFPSHFLFFLSQARSPILDPSPQLWFVSWRTKRRKMTIMPKRSWRPIEKYVLLHVHSCRFLKSFGKDCSMVLMDQFICQYVGWLCIFTLV